MEKKGKNVRENRQERLRGLILNQLIWKLRGYKEKGTFQVTEPEIMERRKLGG